MFKIEGNEITLTRGDTLLLSVGMRVGDEMYVPASEDSISFALKSNKVKRDKSDYVDEQPLILKSIPIETCLLRLDPADTKTLPCGDYVYDIELTRADGVVDTFINNAPFNLVLEVN